MRGDGSRPATRRLSGLARIALLLALVPLQSCVKARPPAAMPAPPLEQPAETPGKIKVQIVERGAAPVVRTLRLEEYVAGCVDAELGRLDVDPAVAGVMRRVQAVLCRTFALASLGRHASEGFDLCSNTHCQLYRHLPPESLTARTARQAATDTDGLVLVFDGRPIQALYHASCGGKTSRADAVWGGAPAPYLTTVSDPTCTTSPPWHSAIDRERLRQALHADARTDPGNRLDQIAVAARDDVGRAVSVTIVGTASRTVRGETFRTVVMQTLGAQSLRSTWFTVRRDGSDFVFDGRGSGHGAGLCQAGAIAQARAGRSDAAILAYYFPGARLMRLTGADENR